MIRRSGRVIRRAVATVAVLVFVAAGVSACDVVHPPGPRWPVGIPTGTVLAAHPGGTLAGGIEGAPAVYDSLRFSDDITVGCLTIVARSWAPAVHSTCEETGQLRPYVVGSQIGADDSCFGGAGIDRGNYVLFASRVGGSSDAARLDGASGDGVAITISDSILKTYACSAGDHNDGVQAYQTDGDSVMELVHNDIDARPVNGGGGVNAAVMVGDNSTGHLLLDGNVVAGGGYVLRLKDAMTYAVQRNIVVAGSAIYGYVHADPERILSWVDNTLSDGTPLPDPRG